MANVISADSLADRHYKHSGFSSTITDSYASPSTYPRGITWDGSNVISADDTANRHYKHSGFSSTITDSYASPSGTPTGITWDGSNVISADDTANRHYKHSGFSSTITDSYSSPSGTPTGITWDGSNVISAAADTTRHYKHSGFSSTITDSYSSPSWMPRGITWDDSNVICADSGDQKHYKHSGFSSTITDSYASPDVSPRGITWDGRYAVAEITGTLDVTLGTLTLSSAGTVVIQGVATPTLGALTLSGTGAVEIAGELDVTLGTLTLSASGTAGLEVVLQPSSQDTYASEDFPTNNYGSYDWMAIRGLADNKWRSYVQWDLSSLVGKTIISAVMHLYVHSVDDLGAPYPDTIDVRRCTSSWDEATLTWNIQPSIAGTNMGSIPWHKTTGVWVEYDLDLTEFGLMVATNYGLRLWSKPDDVGGTNAVIYATKENATEANRPKLIVYVLEGGQPTQIRTQRVPTGSGYRDRIRSWNLWLAFILYADVIVKIFKGR